MTQQPTQPTMTDQDMYILYPEEPELQILVKGRFLRFTNGRLIIKPGPYAQGILDELSSSKRDFVFTEDLHDPMIRDGLMQRVMDVAARKAHAANAQLVLKEARFMMATMVAVSQDDLPRMGTQQLAAALKATMPQAAAEMLIPDDFTTEAKQRQDADMIERGLKENPQEDLVNADASASQNQPVAPQAPQLPEEPVAGEQPAVNPASPYADIVSEEEEPQPPAETPFS